MAYFKPSSQHPDTLICVKNHAVSELQWRINQNLIQTINDASFKDYTVSEIPGVVTQASLNVIEDMVVQTVVIEAYFHAKYFTYLKLDLISPSGTVSPILTGDNDVLQGLHDGKSMLNGNAGNDVLMAYLGTVNGEQIDASAALASVALFGNGGPDTLIGGSSSDLLVAPTATSATLRGGNGADVFRIKNAGMNGNITINDFSITQGDHLDLDELLSGFAADSFIEDCVQLTKISNDALLKFDLSGDGVFNTSNALSIQLSEIYTRQTVAEVSLRSLMYGLQADTVI